MVVSFGYVELNAEGSERQYRNLRLNVGKRINPKDWDGKSGRPSVEYSVRDRLRLHSFLDEQEKLLLSAMESLVNAEFLPEITPEEVKRVYLKKTGRLKTRVVKVRVTKDIANWIEKSELSPLTTNNYWGLVHQLTSFEEALGQQLFWHEFNQVVFDKFCDFITSQKAYKASTLWAFQKRLVAAFNRAKEQGYLPPNVFIAKRFKYRTPAKPYLNWEQIAAVINYECETDSLRQAQKHFTVLALTGLRFSDLAKFYENYDQGTAFDFSSFRVTKSPSPEVLVPVLLPVKRVLKKGFPAVSSNVQLNLKLKALCGQVLPYSVAKGVSCHTLRRSFVTNFLSLSIVPEHVIAKLTGHSMSKERTVFHSYNKISLFENAQVFVRLLSTVDSHQTGGLRLVEFVEQQLMN